MTKEESKELRERLFIEDYYLLRKTMKHSKALHAIAAKYHYSYFLVSSSIPKEIVNHFETTRPMIRKKQQLQLFSA